MKQSNISKVDSKVEIVTGFSCNNNYKFCSTGNKNFNKTTEQYWLDM